MLQLARFGATHLDAIICPGDGQYAIVDAGSAVAEELLSVAVLDLLRWVLFISFEMQSSDAAMGEWLQWVGSRLRASSWRTRSSPIAERASHSAFAWEISPRSKTTGFNPSDGDMLSRRIGLIHPIVLGRPRARGDNKAKRCFGWSTAFIASMPAPLVVPAQQGAVLSSPMEDTLIGAATNRPSRKSPTQPFGFEPAARL